MDEYLPSIGIQNGFNYPNNYFSHQRYSSYDNSKKNYNKNYNYLRYNNNYRSKQGSTSNNYPNNFLRVANTNRDEINSIKNSTSITYYNKSYLNKKNNNKNQNNLFPETYYNYYQKYREKKPTTGIGPNQKSYNNIKKFQDNSNSNNYNIHNATVKNFHLFLPDFPNEKNNNNIISNNTSLKLKIERGGKPHSYSVSKKDNNNNMINNININSNFNYNIKNNNDFFNYPANSNQKIMPKTSGLTTIGFLPNKNSFQFSQVKPNIKRRGLSTDNKYFTPYKTSNLFNKNNYPSTNKKKCPLCHKEIENYRYKFHVNLHPSKVFDWLFLGSYRNACDRKEIKDLGINYVLNCAVECLESFPNNVKYCHLKLNDMPSFKILPHLERATSFINQAKINNGIILVHCQMGISRSTSCVIAYMIRYMGYTAMNALEFIKKKRPIVMPNFGFLNQLMSYEKNNMGTGTNTLNENNENKPS